MLLLFLSFFKKGNAGEHGHSVILSSGYRSGSIRGRGSWLLIGTFIGHLESKVNG